MAGPDITHPDDVAAGIEASRRHGGRRDRRRATLEKRYVHADGQDHLGARADLAGARRRPASPLHAVVQVQDITEQQARAEAQLAYQARPRLAHRAAATAAALMHDLERACSPTPRAEPPLLLVSSTSTASRPTTTPSAIPPATRCCTRLGRALAPRGSGRGDAPTGWAATSSACWLSRTADGPTPLAAARPTALTEHGEGFDDHGVARRGRRSRPRRRRAAEALGMADQRMYAQQERASAPRRAPERPTCCCRVLAERNPELGAHLDDVTRALREAVGREARPRREEQIDHAAAGRGAARRRQGRDPRRDPRQARPARRRPSGSSCAATR